MNTDLVFMYQGKISVLGFNITGGNVSILLFRCVEFPMRKFTLVLSIHK